MNCLRARMRHLEQALIKYSQDQLVMYIGGMSMADVSAFLPR